MEEDLKLETLLKCLGQEIQYATEKLSQNTQKALISLDKNHDSHIFSGKLSDVLSKLFDYSSQFASNLKEIITEANLCSQFSNVLAKLDEICKQNTVDLPQSVNLHAPNIDEARDETDFDRETILNENSPSNRLNVVIDENVIETNTIPPDGGVNSLPSVLDNLNNEERNEIEFDRETILNENSTSSHHDANDDDIFETSTVCADVEEENTLRLDIDKLNASNIGGDPNKTDLNQDTILNNKASSHPNGIDENVFETDTVCADDDGDSSNLVPENLPSANIKEEPIETNSSQETVINEKSTSIHPLAIDENTEGDHLRVVLEDLNAAYIDVEYADIDSDQETVVNEKLTSRRSAETGENPIETGLVANSPEANSDSTFVGSEEMNTIERHSPESGIQRNDQEPGNENHEETELILSQQFNFDAHEIPVSKEKKQFLKTFNLRPKRRNEAQTDTPDSSQEGKDCSKDAKEKRRILNLISRYYLRKRSEMKKKYAQSSDSETDENDKVNTQTDNEQITSDNANIEVIEESVKNNNNINNNREPSQICNKRRLSCDNDNNSEPIKKKAKLNTSPSIASTTLNADHRPIYERNEVQYELNKEERDELLEWLNASLKKTEAMNEKDNSDERAETLSQNDLLGLMNEFSQIVQQPEEMTVYNVSREEPVVAKVTEELGDLLSDDDDDDDDDDTVSTISSASRFDGSDCELEQIYETVMQRQKRRDLEHKLLVEHNMVKVLHINLERLDVSQYLEDASASDDSNDTDKLCDLSTVERKRTDRPRRSRRRIVSSSSSSTSSSMDTNLSDNSVNLLFEDFNGDCHDQKHEEYDEWASTILDQIVDSSDEQSSLSSYHSDSTVKSPKVKRRKRVTKTGSVSDSDAAENSSDEEVDYDSLNVSRKSAIRFESDSDLSSLSDSSDQERERPVTPDDVIVIEDNEDSPNKSATTKGRRNIRALVDDVDLAEATQKANNEEVERIKRLEETSKQRKSFARSESFKNQLTADDQDAMILDVYKEQRVAVHPKIARRLKRHQREGIQFMWDSCYESIKQIEAGWNGSGCILAHCMGLGKTLQALALIHALFKSPLTKTKHVLVVCPLSTVSNWKKEYRLAYKDIFDSLVRLYILENKSAATSRFHIVKKWWSTGGLLVMGYECFGTLTKEDKLEKWQQQNLCNKENILGALVDPGPDLVICDEGHLLRNKQSQRSVALNKVKTRRRIILTGTPLQNNLIEYYYMVNFVKPNLLGTIREYTTNFVNPISNGQFEDSTAEDIMLMKKRTHVLHKILNKAVQRFEDTELKQYLPKLIDQAVFVKLTKIQADMYNRFLDLIDANRPTAYTKDGKVSHKSFLSDVQQLRYICVHPEVLVRAGKASSKIKEQDVIEDQLELEAIDERTGLQKDWYKDLLPSEENDVQQLELGTKLLVALSIIEESAAAGDKILIFVQTYAEMDTLELFLGKSLQYKKNRDYIRMDGTISPEVRSQMCDRFNNPKEKNLKAFIMSSKVGGLGLNITAANRVIILSVSWNPSVDTQSVFRTFRFGQTKTVYIYRLVTLETVEEKIYQRVITKLAVAHRVVDRHQITRHYTAADIQAFYSARPSDNWERPVPSVPEDRILAHLIQKHKCVFRWHEHQTLLKNRPEEDLNEQQKNSAWEEYNRKELAPPVPTVRVIIPGDISASSTVQYTLGYKVPSNPTAYQTFIRQKLMRQLNGAQTAQSGPICNSNQIRGRTRQPNRSIFIPNSIHNVSHAENGVIHISSDEDDDVVVNEIQDPLAGPISSESNHRSNVQMLLEEYPQLNPTDLHLTNSHDMDHTYASVPRSTDKSINYTSESRETPSAASYNSHFIPYINDGLKTLRKGATSLQKRTNSSDCFREPLATTLRDSKIKSDLPPAIAKLQLKGDAYHTNDQVLRVANAGPRQKDCLKIGNTGVDKFSGTTLLGNAKCQDPEIGNVKQAKANLPSIASVQPTQNVPRSTHQSNPFNYATESRKTVCASSRNYNSINPINEKLEPLTKGGIALQKRTSSSDLFRKPLAATLHNNRIKSDLPPASAKLQQKEVPQHTNDQVLRVANAGPRQKDCLKIGNTGVGRFSGTTSLGNAKCQDTEIGNVKQGKANLPSITSVQPTQNVSRSTHQSNPFNYATESRKTVCASSRNYDSINPINEKLETLTKSGIAVQKRTSSSDVFRKPLAARLHKNKMKSDLRPASLKLQQKEVPQHANNQVLRVDNAGPRQKDGLKIGNTDVGRFSGTTSLDNAKCQDTEIGNVKQSKANLPSIASVQPTQNVPRSTHQFNPFKYATESRKTLCASSINPINEKLTKGGITLQKPTSLPDLFQKPLAAPPHNDILKSNLPSASAKLQQKGVAQHINDQGLRIATTRPHQKDCFNSGNTGVNNLSGTTSVDNAKCQGTEISNVKQAKANLPSTETVQPTKNVPRFIPKSNYATERRKTLCTSSRDSNPTSYMKEKLETLMKGGFTLENRSRSSDYFRKPPPTILRHNKFKSALPPAIGEAQQKGDARHTTKGQVLSVANREPRQKDCLNLVTSRVTGFSGTTEIGNVKRAKANLPSIATVQPNKKAKLLPIGQVLGKGTRILNSNVAMARSHQSAVNNINEKPSNVFHRPVDMMLRMQRKGPTTSKVQNTIDNQSRKVAVKIKYRDNLHVRCFPRKAQLERKEDYASNSRPTVRYVVKEIRKGANAHQGQNKVITFSKRLPNILKTEK